MKKQWLSVVVAVVLALSFPVLSAVVSEYDAVYTIRSAGETITQKLFFKGGTRIRMEMKAKDGTNVKMITRLDRNVTWMLMDSEKMYMEQKLDPASWKQYQCNEQKAKKVGSENVLGYKCDIYELVEGQWKYSYWLIPNTGAIARSVITENGKETFRMEALEIHLVKQADSLFEVPAGYQKFTFNMNIPKM